MASFITKHIISEIEKYTRNLQWDQLYFFDKEITYGKEILDKIGKYSVFEKERKIPYSLYQLKKETLIEIYEKIKENKITTKTVRC